MRLCISERGFDFNAWAALGSSVSLAEAKKIEAVLCVEGDNRHTFQTWYSGWVERQGKKPHAGQPVEEMFAEMSGRGAVDIEVVQRELAAVVVALADTQESLAKNRQDIATGGEGFDPQIVDVLEIQLKSLTNSRGLLEEQLTAAGVGDDTTSSARGGVSDGDGH